MTNMLLVALGIVLNCFAQVALKYASRGLGPMTASNLMAMVPGLALKPAFLLGLVLYALSVVNWVVVLSRMDLMVAYPAMSLGYVLTFVLGILFFQEQPSVARIAGLGVIVVGVYLITRPVPQHA